MKPSYLILLAIIAGLLASVGVSRLLLGGHSNGSSIVVASHALDPGQTLSPNDLKTIAWPSDSRPGDSFGSIDKLVGRVVRQAVYPGELIMNTDLAAEGARGGLASTIEPGKRAITVRVNDVIAVAGFAFPGSYVDVLVSAKNPGGEQFSKIVLHRVKILAIAQDTSADPTKPKVVNAVTLELAPDEAEELDLARSVGTLSLVLRNELDKQPVGASGALLEGLMRGTSPKRDNELPKVPSVPVQSAPAQTSSPSDASAPATARSRMIEMRGTAVIETLPGVPSDRK